MEKSSSYHAWGSFERWLKKIAVNEALMYLRSRPEMMEVDDNLPDQVEEPVETDENLPTFTQEDFEAVIRKLDVKQRTVFNLYAVEHWTHKHIAKELGISVANSKVLLSRARAELQGMLAARRIKKLRN
jgi:RNA polymerase sigma-70 factor (ECF subfamily)